jgi:hypothetical protein
MIISEASGRLGTTVGFPESPEDKTCSRYKKEMPPFILTPPWQEVQLAVKIGRTSLEKSTFLAEQRLTKARVRETQRSLMMLVSLYE